MPSRRTLAGLTLLGLAFGLSGCGWEPLYANREAGPADTELRAIRVAPIPERVGQRLALSLREALNPSGIDTLQRFTLRVTLQVVRLDLGVQTQGLGTRGRVDIYANYLLSETPAGTQVAAGSNHAAESFDILANEYSNVVAEDDARNRAAEEIGRDIIARLTIVMQHRAAEHAAK